MNVAVVTSNYTRRRGAAKAHIRYIEHRPGRDGARLTRTLFDTDGRMTRQEAYTLIDNAQPGSAFFRFVISPDPAQEDTNHDLLLREITGHTMGILDRRQGRPVSYIAAIHADHTRLRHIHVLAIVEGRLEKQDFPALTKAATQAALEQRWELDVTQERKLTREREGDEWERER